MNIQNISGRSIYTINISPLNNLKLTETNQIKCDLKGKALSREKFIWKIDKKEITKNKNVFTIESTTSATRVSSTFTLKNPTSFEPDTEIGCYIGRIYKKVIVNSDFRKSGENLLKLYFRKNSGSTGDFCSKYEGAVESLSFDGCIFQALEIQQLPHAPTDCIGKVMSFQIDDYTYSSKYFDFLIVNLNDSTTIKKSQKGSKLRINNLIPNNVYDIEVRFQPEFWKNKAAITKRFNNKATVPGLVDITNAAIREGSCEIEYNIPGNIKENQIEWLYLNILSQEITKENDSNVVKKFEYKVNKERLKFATDNNKFRYLFSINAQSCSELSGDKSKQIPCLASTVDPNQEGALSFVYYFLFLILIALVVLLRTFTKWRRASKKKKRKAKKDIFKKEKGDDIETEKKVSNKGKVVDKRKANRKKDQVLKKDKYLKKKEEKNDQKKKKQKIHEYFKNTKKK